MVIVVAALALSSQIALAKQSHAAREAGSPARPLTMVVERVVRGDVVIAANSNLRSAGGWDPSATGSAVDVDRDHSLLCVRRGEFAAACADNSSSARLDVPPGARVVHARLYVETSLSATAGPLRVRVAGPGARRQYKVLGMNTARVPKLREDSAVISSRAVLRQAVWDVTEYVIVHGAGRYTVADIVSERAGPYLPYASWAIVAVYERDPAAGAIFPRLRARFARRAVSWHDGFVLSSEPAGARARFAVAPGQAVFARSLHVVANARRGGADNLLFNGRPLGNNLTPGDRPSPPGVKVARNRSCNSTTDVFNDTICVLGAPVASKRPGPSGYFASSDGATASSGSAVDIDVIRIPDRYLVEGPSTSTVEVRTVADHPVAVGVLAVSADLGDVTP
jgi:hypothetical protein